MSVANPTNAPLTVVFSVRTSANRTRNETMTAPAYGAVGTRLAQLVGSLLTDQTITITRVTATCGTAGAVPCTASLLLPVSPSCRP